jgi:hypothetical protein
MTAGADRDSSFAGADRDENAVALIGQTGLFVNETGKMMASVEKTGNQHDPHSDSPGSLLSALAGYRCNLGEWPSSWTGDERDILPGRKLVECFTPFLLQLAVAGLSGRPFKNISTTCGFPEARSSETFRKHRGSGTNRSMN